ncbi:signal peptidase I [Bifidobacterium leontopitheci]|uniref:Signal peptidase I n=1 Tax=Bifidobacterium leontopitheci TaxID=2650774 RepID=A0A6I1GLC3_9BIFI|nr:signal peptidase I [Bifidobacterium leontopitheci]KAB7790406.1 S26 family signal peptidase [Bifidobacterium leontopitheci]
MRLDESEKTAGDGLDGDYAESSGDAHIFAVADRGVNPGNETDGGVTGDIAGNGSAVAVSLPATGPRGRRSGKADRNGKPGRDDDSFTWKDLLIWCGIPILVIALIRIFLVGFYVIPSGSMRDTIEIGDKVITSKLTPKYFDLQRGDIVVFHDPANWLSAESSSSGDDYLIKRLIGLPGDTVECAGAGEPVKVNGVAIDETPYIRPGVDPSLIPFKVKVTAGHIFVMGDNRPRSADSRYHPDDGDHGLVPISKVVGVGLVRFWPLNRIGLLDSHHDVFRNVPDRSATAFGE